MSQPEWQLISSTDCTALYVDTTGVYPPELAIVDEVHHDDEDIEATAAIVYRFPLERCWIVDREEVSLLVSVDPHSAQDRPHPIARYIPWFASDMRTIAESAGIAPKDLTDALCSDDPVELAMAYEAIGGYCGYDNFDAEPQEWTASEFADWPERGPKLSTEERAEFATAYVFCALWCGVCRWKHAGDCPCHDPSENGESYEQDACMCEPELVSHDDADAKMAERLTEQAGKELLEEAYEFYASNIVDLRATDLAMARLGHDFWLSRNRHGAGFWDRKHVSEAADAALERLTEAAHGYGEQSLVENADMTVTVMA
jgi:hypothetical protein